MIAGLRRAFRQDKLVFFGTCRSLAQQKQFSAFLRTLFRDDWVVYAKKPFGGPEHVLHYLARYIHRVAISNQRIVDVTDALVTFRWKDNAHHSKRRIMTLTHEEFLRRFLQQSCPCGFPRIRHFGLFANRRRGALLPLYRTLLALQPPPVLTTAAVTPILWLCPRCQGPMRVVERLICQGTAREESRPVEHLDSPQPLLLTGCGFGDAFLHVRLLAQNDCFSRHAALAAGVLAASSTGNLTMPQPRNSYCLPGCTRKISIQTP